MHKRWRYTKRRATVGTRTPNLEVKIVLIDERYGFRGFGVSQRGNSATLGIRLTLGVKIVAEGLLICLNWQSIQN
jgi:hypothetical protein